MADMASTVRKNIRNTSKPLELRELNRQLEWLWRKLLGGLDAKAFSEGGMQQVSNTVEKNISTNVNANSIETNLLSAAIAKMMVSVIGICDADFLNAIDVNIENLIVRKGLGDSFTFQNLKIMYAQIVHATVGDLCIQASDGNYYTLDVDADGKVTASIASVTENEIVAGHTDGGKVIIGTSIVADELNTGDLYATFALVNKLDAAKINVDTLVSREVFAEKLFAAEAFINRLKTSAIVGDKSIEMVVDQLDQVESTMNDVQTSVDNALPRVEFQRVVRIDNEGLHVGDNRSNGEVLVDSNSVNVVFNGQKYSKFSSNYVQFGNYQLRRSSDGGLVFKLA